MKYPRWLSEDFIVEFVELKRNTGRKSSEVDFKDSSVATKRRKLMEIKDKYAAIEIREAFLRHLGVTFIRRQMKVRRSTHYKCIQSQKRNRNAEIHLTYHKLLEAK